MLVKFFGFMETAALNRSAMALDTIDSDLLLDSGHGLKIFDFNSKPSTEVELRPKHSFPKTSLVSPSINYIDFSPCQKTAKGKSAVLEVLHNSYDLSPATRNALELLEGLGEKTTLLQEAAEHIEEAISIFSGSSSSTITSNSYSRLSHKLSETITDAAKTRKMVEEYLQHGDLNSENVFSSPELDFWLIDSWSECSFTSFGEWVSLFQGVLDTLGNTVTRLLHYQLLFIGVFLHCKSAHYSSSITKGIEGYTPYLTWPRPPTLAYQN